MFPDSAAGNLGGSPAPCDIRGAGKTCWPPHHSPLVSSATRGWWQAQRESCRWWGVVPGVSAPVGRLPHQLSVTTYRFAPRQKRSGWTQRHQRLFLGAGRSGWPGLGLCWAAGATRVCIVLESPVFFLFFVSRSSCVYEVLF